MRGFEFVFSYQVGLAAIRALMRMKSAILKGVPASPGVYVGQAILAERPTVAIEAGDVLIIENASLDWFEAMVQAGAVVTETGGKTSHAATICRELGKPCVTAVANVMGLVKTGQQVAVDGGGGTVTILSNES